MSDPSPDPDLTTHGPPRPAPDAPSGRTIDHTPGPDAGTVLGGRYKLIEEVGEGGMGTVWMAQQTEPVKRMVAVKVVKAGMDSKAVLARFEAERQALALMDHPNISRVFDAGAAPDGRPFFVMELVKGVPITKFCDERRLTPRERLELFVPVCQAIQHAHQKGVIHRDIKPNNVLVALYDDRPVPKVIDFGVAKAAGQPLTDKTLATGFGAVVGTPEYMSPEQASFNNLDVDTRSDVYALGVLLYELLAGSPPFSRHELEKAGVLEMLRVIREKEPPKPSTKLSTADALPTLSANRGTEPRALTRLLRGEIDWIVMKALEKDRNRRYETATGLAADVLRYLAGEAVQAVPPSTGYRLRKFVSKNRGAVFAGSVVLLALVAGVVGATWGLIHADNARRVAEAAEANERAERGKAEAARKDADEQRQKAERQAAQLFLDKYDYGVGDHKLLALHLARWARTIPPHCEHLRQYATMQLVTQMQEYRSLGPEFGEVGGTGRAVSRLRITPDGRHVVGVAGDEVAVWEVMTHRRVARLSEAGERVWRWDFAEGGRWAYTVAEDESVRVWELPTHTDPTAGARLVLRTPPLVDELARRARGERVIAAWLSLPNLLVHTGWSVDSAKGPPPGVVYRAELWNVAQKRRVAAWAGDGRQVATASFNPDGSLLLTAGPGPNAQVRRTSDGAVVKELPHTGQVTGAAFSPSGGWAATLASNTVYWWRADTWQPVGPLCHCKDVEVLRFVRDDAVVAIDGLYEASQYLVCRGHPMPVGLPSPYGESIRWALHGNRLVGGDWILDLDTRQVSKPPLGSQFHPEAATAADGGRWLVVEDSILDLSVGRYLDTPSAGPVWGKPVRGLTRLPGGGYAITPSPPTTNSNGWNAEVFYVPPPSLDVPADVLELFVQVVLRAELRDGDQVTRLGEEEWERKRQELAARANPTPGFPFPGRVATDRHHWLREEVRTRSGDLSSGDPTRMKREDIRELAALWDRLVGVEPTAARYAQRSWVRAHLDRWEDAADDYLASARLEPERTAGLASAAASWTLEPGRPAEQYRAAVRLAEAARWATPEDWRPVQELAIAYYRVGRDRDAVALLREADGHRRREQVVRREVAPRLLSPWAAAAAEPATPHPENLAVRAMAHHRIGEAAEARALLAELRTLIAAPQWAKDETSAAWFREAVELIEGLPAKK